MAKRPSVPQFGNWEGETNLPYTVFFDEARKAKNGGKMINPNDPMDYPGMFPYSPKASPPRATNAPEQPIDRRAVRTTLVDTSPSRQNGDVKKFSDNQRPVVPQFGNWDGQGNIPYTIYFDEARKSKLGGKMVNPNDPMEYPGMFPSSPQATPFRSKNVPEEPLGKTAVRPTTLDSQSGGNKDRKRFTDTPVNNDNVIRGVGSPHHNRGGRGPGSDQPGRQNVGLVHSIDRSPLHPQLQAKRNEKSGGSPAWESKRPNGISNATPGRSRMKPVSTGVQYPEKSAAVPRFGEWDEENPSSGENYTHAFNQVHHEKISGSPMVSNMSAEQPSATRQKQNVGNKYKLQSRWFPCFGKACFVESTMASSRLPSYTPFTTDMKLPIETSFKLPAPLPSWPAGTNFATGIVDLGALQVSQITSLNKVWATYERGPDNQGSTFYEPASIPEGFFMLGCYAQPNNQPLYGWVLVAKDVSLPGEQKALALPTDYTLLYYSVPENIAKSGDAYIWLPVAPDGYSAMGYVVTASPEKPPLDKVRVVRSELTEDVEFDNWIWGSEGLNVYGLRPVDRGSKALGISMGTFNLQLNGKEMHKLSCLTNLNFSYPSMPNLNQVHALLQAYTPVVYMHSEEKYFPSRVSWFFQNGALLYTKGQESSPVGIAYNGGNLPQNGSNDGAYWIDLPSDNTASENLKKGNLQSAYSYIHIKPALGGTFTDIQVWLFYPFNGPSKIKIGWFTISLKQIGEHVGDWEHVTLRISNFNGELRSVYFAKHNKGDWVSSPSLEFETNNKPVVYSARYGHASYPTPGAFLHKLAEEKAFVLPKNVTSKSDYRMDTGARYWILGADYLGSLGIVEEPWLNFARQWGPKKVYAIERFLQEMQKTVPGSLFKKLEQFIRSLSADILGEEGPTGPKWKDTWSGDERI
ncbi:hypothetical protein POM88_049254 [Heracleum sosnowskyi]|uniref:RIN4 pathogenic type III effector avirulence factor Avr cleavage site domain-containing protein n=1 Tax=Heracleum sosnowskyi TaxID=360622 RepID=A0AAD8M1I2_9APIA|nr:hypothetical protein POM88_049254 [Heracleum sosnowskyi]